MHVSKELMIMMSQPRRSLSRFNKEKKIMQGKQPHSMKENGQIFDHHQGKAQWNIFQQIITAQLRV